MKSAVIHDEGYSPRLPLIALPVVQIAVGYEWSMSGLTKIVRWGFPSRLAADLHDNAAAASPWYRSLPNRPRPSTS